MFERVATYTNLTAHDQIAWMEPWCEEITIPPGKTITLKGRGTVDGEIEIEKRHEGIIVYGWPTSSITVECEEQQIWQSYAEVPPVPAGMTMRGFAKLFFHEGRPDTPAK